MARAIRGKVSRAVVGSIGEQVTGLGFAGGFLWLGRLPNELIKIDPRTLEVLATITVGRSPQRIVYGFGFLWMTNSADGTLMQVDIG